MKNNEIEEIDLKNIIENMPGYIYWKNTKSQYMGCNINLTRVSGLKSCAEIVGKTDDAFVWGKDESESFRQDDQEVMASGVVKIMEHELPLNTADKSSIYVRTEKIPLHNEHGKAVGVLGVALDISDLKKTQNALKEQVKKTELAYQSKAEFLSSASHEIRNPISNLISILDELDEYVELMKDSLSADNISFLNKVVDYSNEAKAEAYRSLNSLINLSDLYRLQTEGVKSKFELSDISDLINKAANNSVYPNNKKIHLKVDINAKVPKESSIDYHNVYEALRIIIGNAIRFSPENSSVAIQTDITQKNNKFYLVVIVQDEGDGIPESQLKFLFQPLQLGQEYNEKAKYHKPSLQLSLAKMKIEASGGDIRVKSVLKKGTQVTLLIPYNVEPERLFYTNDDKQKSVAVIKNILLVEDDITGQKITKRLLEDLGYHVDASSTGTDAINKALHKNYDVILLDITLSDMNGIEVMNNIKQATKNKLSFVALTSHASENDIDYFLSEGVVTVLTKPVNKSVLKSCLEDVIASNEI